MARPDQNTKWKAHQQPDPQILTSKPVSKKIEITPAPVEESVPETKFEASTLNVEVENENLDIKPIKKVKNKE